MERQLQIKDQVPGLNSVYDILERLLIDATNQQKKPLLELKEEIDSIAYDLHYLARATELSVGEFGNTIAQKYLNSEYYKRP